MHPIATNPVTLGTGYHETLQQIIVELMKSCTLYLLSIAQLQIYVTEYPYYHVVQEGDGNISICFQTNRVVTEPLHVYVETTYMNTTGSTQAIGKTNMILYM